jgi:chromosome segregation ATPase
MTAPLSREEIADLQERLRTLSDLWEKMGQKHAIRVYSLENALEAAEVALAQARAEREEARAELESLKNRPIAQACYKVAEEIKRERDEARAVLEKIYEEIQLVVEENMPDLIELCDELNERNKLNEVIRRYRDEIDRLTRERDEANHQLTKRERELEAIWEERGGRKR